MLDRRRVRESRVRAAEPLGDARVEHGEAAHVQLVDHRVGPGRLGAPVVHPLVVRGAVVDDHALGDVRGGVAVVPDRVGDMLLRPVAHMAVDLGGQREVAVDRTGVRVEQQLRRVPAGARPGVPATVDPESVALAGTDVRHEAVPDLMGQLGQRQTGLRTARAALGVPAGVTRPPVRPAVEEAQFDRLRAARPEREIGAGHSVGADPVTGPERGGRARPHRPPGRAGSGARPQAAADDEVPGEGTLPSGAVSGGSDGSVPVPGAYRLRRHSRFLRRLPHRLLYCLLLGCARHVSASRGS